MNAQELFEHLVHKKVKEIYLIFWWLSVKGEYWAQWDGKLWTITSYPNSDDISVSEYIPS